MKLHLPTRLRKALLACLAVAVPTLTSTLATGSALLAGFCSFSTLRAEQSAPSVPEEWGGLSDFLNYDTTKDITGNEDGQLSFGTSDEADKGTMYFVWALTDRGYYELKFFSSEGDLNKWKDSAGGYSGQSFTLEYKNNYGTGNGYSWNKKSDGSIEWILTTSGSDVTVGGVNQARIRKGQGVGQDVSGVFYNRRFSGSDSEMTGTLDQYYEIYDTAYGRGGAAIFLDGGDSLGSVSANFIYNQIEDKGGKDNRQNPHGGAIYTARGSRIDSITGDFVSNGIRTTGKGYGGAIYNMGNIDSIDANFIGNYVVSTQNNAANGGAIVNGKESSAASKEEIGGYIGSIQGYFVGNYAFTVDGVMKDTLGGAIINYGHIGSINAVFIGNYSESPQTGNSGVLRNYAQQHRLATIGPKELTRDVSSGTITSGFNDTVVLNGIFIGNYAKGGEGDAFAGVMRNNGDINGKISGLYVGNYASTLGVKLESKTTEKKGTYNYLNGTGDSAKIGQSGMAYGGAYYNDIKAEKDQAKGKPYIGGFENAVFIDNHASSKWGLAFGGAIFNQNADTGDITGGEFLGNYVISEHLAARGGAIYNDTTEAGYNFGIDNTEENIPYYGNIQNITSQFNGNYAKGKMAQGGAIYVSNSSTIGTIGAESDLVFITGNYAESVVADDDSTFYWDIQDAENPKLFSFPKDLEDRKLTPKAQGGALYVADAGTTQSIYATFEKNFAKTNGVGKLSEGSKSVNGSETAQGGAIYVSGLTPKWPGATAPDANIQNITGDFLSNYVENAGKTSLTDVKAVAQGGAVYVNTGTVQNMISSFSGNEARGKSTGSNVEEVQGGAIYVNGGKIGNIGRAEGNIYYIQTIGKNKVEAWGQGSQLTSQTTQGGAIYVNLNGEVGNIYANFQENTIEAKLADSGATEGNVDKNNLTTRTAQGGAIYLNEDSKILNIYGTTDVGFDKNGITVSGEKSGARTAILVQGGAIYVNSASTENIIAGFSSNYVVNQAVGNTEEVQGGAIYVNGGKIGNIGRAEGNIYYIQTIEKNKVEAWGQGSQLTSQTTQGGAIYVNSGGEVMNIYANFQGNTIEAKLADSGATEGNVDKNGLTTRTAQGGAIYLNEDSEILNIYGTAGVGFDMNGITVSGDKSGASTDILVQGGALYVNQRAHTENIRANFTNNYARSEAKNATSEKVGGGAIYVADQGYIGNIGQKEGGYILADISKNSVTASGLSTNLTTQWARGGAILVAAQGDKGYSIMSIYTSGITDNTVTAGLDEDLNTNALERTARGGAIYVADSGTIEDIGAYKLNNGSFSPDDPAAFGNNTVTVTGGHADNNATLNAQGGALYVANEASVQNIVAHFTGNEVNTLKANGNSTETVQGGAIFVDRGASIQNIGRNGDDDKENRGWALVNIDDNKLIAGGLGSNLTAQKVQGGAIYVSTSPTDGSSLGYIYASSISNNKIEAAAGDSTELATREVQGGAIYLFEEADMMSIGASSKNPDLNLALADISENTITVTGGNEENTTKLKTGGGAIFAGSNAEIKNIHASFVHNGIDTSGAKGNASETLQGGAIHLSGGASTGNIGDSAKKAAQIRENYLHAGGNGNKNLTEQIVQGGAFYLGMDNGLGGTMGAVFADFVGNKITAEFGDSKQWTARNIQGGAVYLADGSTIASITQASDVDTQEAQLHLSTKQLAKMLMDSIMNPVNNETTSEPEVTHGFVDNHIIVSGGKDSQAQGDVLLVVQGGALYASNGASVTGDVIMNFVNNSIDTTKASGSGVERVAGGAIYLSDEAKIIGALGSKNDLLQIKDNALKAGGKGTKLTEQWARGGAVFVGSGGEIGDIYADITYNSINIAADEEGSKVLEKRIAYGGALYVADGGNIGEITQSGVGITHNTITVTGGNAANKTELEAKGGAFFLQDGASADGVMASFTNNGIDTVESKGNASETVGGGAIYLARGSSLNDIGKKGDEVDIKENYLKAGGKGNYLTTQIVQGGAIYVSSRPEMTEPDGGVQAASESGDSQKYSINEIHADITQNTIEAGVGNSELVTTRSIQGGAIYLAKEAAISSIEQKSEDGFGIANNSISVTGGSSNQMEAVLTAQGGAIFVSSGSSIGEINASFTRNTITSNGTSNTSSLAHGGAIYVAGGGSIDDIGSATTSETASVQFVENGVSIGMNVEDKKGVLEHSFAKINAVRSGTEAAKTVIEAQGGAVYLSKDDEGAGSLKDVYADFHRNYAELAVGDIKYVDAKAYGGAVLVSEGASIGHIKGDFEYNYAKTAGVTDANSEDRVHGGAIDVAKEGTAGDIVGNFIGNYVENSGMTVGAEAAADVLDDAKYATGVHAKGGAIYLAEQGSIGIIGSAESMFQENHAAGSGQVRGGAILVTKAYVEEIAGTFYANYADGAESLATFGGAIRFDDSVLVRLESNFYNNNTTGTGGALSLTTEGVIYEVTGDFKGNYAALNGGAVDDLGQIGMRGYVLVDPNDEKNNKTPEDDYSNVLKVENSHNLQVVRDSTDTYMEEKRQAGERKDPYLNQEGRNEFDGSFTGGFVNSNFLYNTVNASSTEGDLTKGYLGEGDNESQYYRGAGIYTNRDLFITANNMQEVVMSGNKIVDENGKNKRSAIYVDNKDPQFGEGDYQSLIVYLVAQNNAVLRIDDNIRGHEESTTGLVVRLRGYTDKQYTAEPYDTSGLIILNNRVEKTYTVMDDVTLYIGYKPRTYEDEKYFKNYTIGSLYDKFEDAKIGDEDLQNIIMPDKDMSKYLDVAGTATRIDGNGKVVGFNRSDRDKTDETKIEFHQSDIFRDSFVSVRSGTVALTENTYSRHKGAEPGGKFTDMEPAEVYTEYLFGGLIAYGADYNYGIYGTGDTKATDGREKTVADLYKDSSMAQARRRYGSQKYPYRWGGKSGRYATFEFGISYNEEDLYDLALANRYYYADMNGNPTEKSFWVDEKGVKHNYAYYMPEGKRVNVVHHMAKSDVLTVFAVWDKDKNDLKWGDAVARGRVTLNGLTIRNVLSDEEAWNLTNKSVSGAQTDGTLENGKDSDVLTEADHFNRDLYVQLINYMLVDDKGELVTMDNENGAKALQKFYAMFDEAEEVDEDGNPVMNGYHLLRLSDHFDLIHNASWAMKGSDILADEIELATTVTKDDSLHIVNWRDHLAEWAEHQASWDGETMTTVLDEDGNPITDADGKEVEEPLETAGLYTGKKHFLLDQSVYYLNRNINIEANPTEGKFAPTGAQMWGQYLTIEGESTTKELNLQGHNMLSWVIGDQQVRLQSFTLTEVKKDARVKGGLIQNDGDLILDTMRMEEDLTINNAGEDYTGKEHGKELDNRSYTLDNRLTVTGVMDIDFTITTLDSEKTGKHGKLVINHSTEVINRALAGWTEPEPETPTTPDPDTEVTEPEPDEPGVEPIEPGVDPNEPGTQPDPNLPDPDLTEAGSGLAGGDTPAGAAMGGVNTLDDALPVDGAPDGNNTTGSAPVSKGDSVLSESIVHITGVVEHQDVTHQGDDEMELGNEELTYAETGEEQKLGTWSIVTGNRNQKDVRETFTSNTYLETTEREGQGAGTKATKQFLAFRDNSLTMEGGAFNLGIMYKHRLPLRYFRVNGGAVFVDHSTINLKEERMGGIDAKNGDALYAGDFEATRGKNTSGTGDGLIWLEKFVIEDTSDKYLVHVKFVDDGVGNAVKDGMGIANGAEKSNMRLMHDGKHKYVWQVTYNDERAENDYEDFYKGKTGVKGMYTFYRVGFTPESQEGPVTDLTGSYVTMMQVYNYSFQHADLYSTNMAAAREQQLYSDHYAVVDVKGKGSVAPVNTCPASSAGLRSGLWLHTYSSTEDMPLRNGPEVHLNMYGGLVGGDSALKEHRNGWGSVWSLYGGYVGSTQKYDDVRIRQNGGVFGMTGSFYKKKFYTAFTASVGVASAATTSVDFKDEFDLIMGGIASRSGYSFEFGGGRYVLQPNVMVSYTMFNTCDYTNAYGSRITAKPTGILQINPFLKFMKNTDCTWRPYTKVGMVYNALGKTKYTFDGTSLPSMSIKPYVEYSVGAQRTFRDRYTLYGEVTGRNGGRNGAEASAGLRVAW